jgi:hypothetical protein
MTKVCSKCRVEKPMTEYWKKGGGRKGLQTVCKQCQLERRRVWNANNPEESRRVSRVRNLARYSLTPEEFDVMLARQGGKCAVCLASEPGGQGQWHIDHDHACCPDRKKSCGQCVRGLLCHSCNTGLGQFQDDPDLLLAAIAYLMVHQPSLTTQ